METHYVYVYNVVILNEALSFFAPVAARPLALLSKGTNPLDPVNLTHSHTHTH